MKGFKQKKKIILLTAAWVMASYFTCNAAEGDILPTSKSDESIVQVALPTVSEEDSSPFDFVIDPQMLIYETDAAKYGGGTVEEGATLLFANREGEYDFSSKSDKLSVSNCSEVPVKVTIRAKLINVDDMVVRTDPDFEDSTECDLYMALIDDEGHLIPLKANEEIILNTELKQSIQPTYVYKENETTGEHEYILAEGTGTEFNTYSFGLTGTCNPNGSWEDISVHPRVLITWIIEPVSGNSNKESKTDPSDEPEDTMEAIIEDSEETNEELTDTRVSDKIVDVIIEEQIIEAPDSDIDNGN